MKGVNNNKKYDFDLYEIEARSPMSTKEITLIVDFLEKKVSKKRKISFPFFDTY